MELFLENFTEFKMQLIKEVNSITRNLNNNNNKVNNDNNNKVLITSTKYYENYKKYFNILLTYNGIKVFCIFLFLRGSYGINISYISHCIIVCVAVK